MSIFLPTILLCLSLIIQVLAAPGPMPINPKPMLGALAITAVDEAGGHFPHTQPIKSIIETESLRDLMKRVNGKDKIQGLLFRSSSDDNALVSIVPNVEAVKRARANRRGPKRVDRGDILETIVTRDHGLDIIDTAVTRGDKNNIDEVLKGVQNTINEMGNVAKDHVEGIMMSIDALQSHLFETIASVHKQVKSTIETAQQVQELFKKPPKSDVFFGKDYLPKPIQKWEALIEETIISKTADDILSKELKFLPSNTKGPAKAFLKEYYKNVFDALCRGKRHENPKVREFSKWSQEQIAKMNYDMHPLVSHAIMNVLCAAKHLPFRR